MCDDEELRSHNMACQRDSAWHYDMARKLAEKESTAFAACLMQEDAAACSAFTRMVLGITEPKDK